ncbi:MAG TPA: VOC family protein [Leptolyngbyaceae cyanobacterium M65_K2018_010]|nr:VOC family protein [Leptolyngbyaceae cyanobacterium M65_K2018_010]
MLKDAQITTILPVIDLERAKDFYNHKLGLTPIGASPDGDYLFSSGGGAKIKLIHKEEGTKAEHTALSFEVSDIGAAIAELEGQGVVFEDYDLPEFKTENHVCVLGAEKAAWFVDTEGNILCIHEAIPPAVNAS